MSFPGGRGLRGKRQPHLSQFEACDMILGRREPDLGGQGDFVDLIGVSFISRSVDAWRRHDRRAAGRPRLILHPGFGNEERLAVARKILAQEIADVTVARIKGRISPPRQKFDRSATPRASGYLPGVASITPRTHSEGAKEFQKTSRREVRRESILGQDSTALLHRRLDDQNL